MELVAGDRAELGVLAASLFGLGTSGDPEAFSLAILSAMEPPGARAAAGGVSAAPGEFFFSNMAMRSRIEGLAIVLRRDVANLCQGSAPHQREVLGRARASTSECGWLLGMLVRKASAIFGARIHLHLAPERIRHAMRAHFSPGPREH